jgi:hypothetical protein
MGNGSNHLAVQRYWRHHRSRPFLAGVHQMNTDFRALCAEILQKLDQYEDGQRVDWDAWRNNARAALARWGTPTIQED